MMSDPQLTGYFANFMVEVSREHTDERSRVGALPSQAVGPPARRAGGENR
jgi:hypothetical protein